MTKLIGILNLTPDSFSDGGLYAAPEAALRAVEAMIAAGAALVDVGAESTRPGAVPVTPQEEWARLEPFFAVALPAVRGRIGVSVDTRHAQTVTRALEQGVDWINDVSGLTDPDMRAVVQESECMLVLMHALGVPADRNVTLPPDADPVAEIAAWAVRRVAELESAGIARARLVLDPGIGFGKTPAQSLEILRRVEGLRAAGLPLLIGHSRKSCLGAERDRATLAVSAELVAKGVEFIRVHDVAAHAELLRHG